MWVSAFTKNTWQRTKHVLHMFCERTVINIRHVAYPWRGTAFSRRRPLLTPTDACSRTLPLASDAVAVLLPMIPGHTQCGNSGIGIFPFSRLPRYGSSMSARQHLERPNIVLSRNSDLVLFTRTGPRAKKKKKTFMCLARTSPRFVFSGVCRFHAFFFFFF